MQAQLEQLKGGQRRAVMVPLGTPMPHKIPNHLKQVYVPRVGRFIIDSKRISASGVRKAVKHNQLPHILGATEGGMGVPDKSQLEGPTTAVVGRAPDGNTTQETLSDSANLPDAIRQTASLTPDDGSVELQDPDATVSARMWQISPEEFLQARSA